MKKIFLCVLLVALSVSVACLADSQAWGDSFEDLLAEANNIMSSNIELEQKIEQMASLFSLERIESLIKSGADVNAKDGHGMTALMWAAGASSNPEVVKALINAGADVNAKDGGGWTALMRAAFNNSNPEVVKVLINAGADVNAKDGGGMTALMSAARINSNPEVVKALINAGADVNAKRGYGFTAKYYARSNGNPEIQKMANVFDYVADKKTALLNAARENATPDAIRFLVECGADVKAKNQNGANALMIAASNTTYPEVIDVLAKAGIDVNAKSNESQTALMYAARFNKNPEVVRALIKAGADVKATDGFFFGKTAKDWAIQSNAGPEIIKILEGM